MGKCPNSLSPNHHNICFSSKNFNTRIERSSQYNLFALFLAQLKKTHQLSFTSEQLDSLKHCLETLPSTPFTYLQLSLYSWLESKVADSLKDNSVIDLSDSSTFVEFVRSLGMKSGYSLAFKRDVRGINERIVTWREAIAKSLMKEEQVNVFESRNSSDEPIRLEFEDIINDEGQFMMD